MQSTTKIIFKAIVIVVVFLCLSNNIFADTQTNLTEYTTPPSVALNPATGNPQTGDFGSIGLFNGRLNYTIPLLKTGGRGAADYTISLDINRLWQFDHYYDVYEEGGNGGLYTQYTLPNSTNWWGDSLKYMPGRLVESSKFGPTPVCNQPHTAGYYSYQGLLRFISQSGAEIALVSQAHPTRVTIECTSYNGNPNLPGTYKQVSLGDVFTTVDGSSIKFVTDQEAWVGYGIPTSGYLYFPDGKKYRIDDSFVSWIEDRNGNRTSFVYEINPHTQRRTKILQIIDSNGRPTDISYGLQNSEYGLHDEIKSYTGLNGAPQTIIVTYGELDDAGVLRAGETLKNQTQLFGALQCQNNQTNCPPTELLNPTVVTSVVFPGNRRYWYKYNSYAELARVETPQGAAFEYDWGGSLEGGDEKGVINYSSTYPDLFRQVLEKRVYHNGGSGNSFEFRTVIHKSSPYDFSAVNLVLTRKVSFFGRNNAPLGLQKQVFWGHPLGPGPKPNQEESYESIFPDLWSGKDKESLDYGKDGVTLLRRELKQWSAETESGVYKVNPRVAKQITIAPEGNQAAVTLQEIEYEGTGSSDYFVNMNPEWIKNYNYKILDLAAASTNDFQSIFQLFGAADVIAWTKYFYAYDQSYRDRNIAGLVTEQHVLDPLNLDSSNQPIVVAKTQIIYDQSLYHVADSGALSGNAAGTWVNPNTNYRGLPTTNRVWNSDTGSWIETHLQYDQYGNVRKVWDANGNVTETEYSTAFACAYPTTVTTADPDGEQGSKVGFVTTANYDPGTGLSTSTTDANGQTTTMDYDALLRPWKVTAPNGHQTITEYGIPDETSGQLPAAQRFVKVKTQIDEQKWKRGETWFDGLGRSRKTLSVDLNGDVFVETEYDNAGRVQKVSNPYRIGETIYWTENFYDDLSRVTKVKTQDNGEILTAYDIATVGANIWTMVTATDQAGKQRRSITNALGQLVKVHEPVDTFNEEYGTWQSATLGTVANPAQETSYEYDALGNLKKVVQGGQERNFAYDSLSRLKEAQNPESGTIKYKYDANGNLKAKLDARRIKTIYEYDNLNRIIKRCYKQMPVGVLGVTTTCAAATAAAEVAISNSPDVAYTYDDLPNALGRLTKVSSTVSETRYTIFDEMGRVKQSQQLTTPEQRAGSQQPYEMSYVYNLAGILTEEKYPSTRTVKNELDEMGYLSAVQSRKNANYSVYSSYARNFTYTAAGAVSSMQLGNGNWETTKFNNRLQPTQIALGMSQNQTNLLRLDYEYGDLDGNGVIISNSNNGNLAKQTITVPGAGETGFKAYQNYDYDSLNRIYIASENLKKKEVLTSYWHQRFKYDRFGNRTFNETATTTLTKNCGTAPNLTVCAADAPVVNPLANPANNRLNGYDYDAAGNMTGDLQNRKYTYDAENKQVKVENVNQSGVPTSVVGQYFYDADGRRVKKEAIEQGIWVTTIFVYNAMGKLVAEYSTNPAPPSTAKVSYTTNDHLGSPRIITDKNGNVTSRRDFLPFGEDIVAAAPTSVGRNAHSDYIGDNIRQKFTGYERDSESSLDFAQARYYGGSHGRFTSPDPLMASARRTNPQTFNRYSYVTNNPLNLVDPLGLEDCDPRKGNCPTTGGIKIQDPCKFGTPNCDPVQIAVVDNLKETAQSMVLLENEVSSVAGPESIVPRELAPVAVGAVAVAGAEPGPFGEAGLIVVGGGILSSVLLSQLIHELIRATPTTTTADPPNNRGFVMVYHGSINDATQIRATGLDPSKGPTWVTRDPAAALNAIGGDRYDVSQGLARDAGIITSRIPTDLFNQHLAPSERPYSGFGGRLISTEIVLRTPTQFQVFNTYIVR